MLAFLGMAAARHAQSWRSWVATLEAHRVVGPIHQHTLRSQSGNPISEEIIGANSGAVAFAGSGNALVLRHSIRGGKLPRALGLDQIAHLAVADRARKAEADLAYLEVANLLASMRAGTVAFQRTAPPL